MFQPQPLKVREYLKILRQSNPGEFLAVQPSFCGKTTRVLTCKIKGDIVIVSPNQAELKWSREEETKIMNLSVGGTKVAITTKRMESPMTVPLDFFVHAFRWLDGHGVHRPFPPGCSANDVEKLCREIQFLRQEENKKK